MTIHQSGPLTFALVQVRENTKWCLMEGNRCLLQFEGASKFTPVMLPDGYWQLIGKAADLDIIQLTLMLPKKAGWYYDYQKEEFVWLEIGHSFASLLAAHGLKAETTYVLKLKEK